MNVALGGTASDGIRLPHSCRLHMKGLSGMSQFPVIYHTLVPRCLHMLLEVQCKMKVVRHTRTHGTPDGFPSNHRVSLDVHRISLIAAPGYISILTGQIACLSAHIPAPTATGKVLMAVCYMLALI